MSDATSTLLSVGEITPDPRWHMPDHFHPFHELIVVTGGRMHLRIDSETHICAAGDVFFYHAGRVHEERSDARWPVATTYLGLRSTEALQLPTRVVDEGGRIRQMAGWLLRDHREHADASVQNSLLAAMIQQVRRLAESRESPWVTDLRARMRAHLVEDVDLDAVAGWAGMSRFAFSRKYKRLSGRSPMQDLRLMRLDRARSMLLTSLQPLKVIAAACHLGDESQFSKLFYGHYKLWPSEARVKAPKGLGPA